MTVSKNNQLHHLEFVKNDNRLAPMGNGEARKDAYDAGVFSDYLVFQYKDAILWV